MAGRTAATRGAQAAPDALARIRKREDSAPVPVQHAPVVRVARVPGAALRGGTVSQLSGAASRHPLSSGWAMTGPTMAAAYAMLAINARAAPPMLGTLLVAIAVALTASAPWLLARRPHADAASHGGQTITLLLVAVPMALFGSGIAIWHHWGSGSNPVLVLGSLVVVGLVVSVTLSGRLPALIAAQTALWAGLAIASAASGAHLLLMLGCIVGIIATFRQSHINRADAAEQIDLRRAQLRAEEILADYEQTGQGWFWETDRRGAITYVSATTGQVLSRDVDQLLGKPLTEMFILDGRGNDGERSLNFHLSARSSFQDLAVRAAKAGEERWWSISGRPIYDGFNNFLGFRGSGSDLTEKLRSQQDASRLAHYDSLTGLANRFDMSLSLEKILNAQQLADRACAVLLLDLDRFKHVNDTMGHPAGDALLKQVAQRLMRTVDDVGRVGRLGGDEFQVILPGRQPRDRLEQMAHRIIESLSQPYSIEGSRVMIGASVGIALSPDDGMTSEALIRNADLALYAAKDHGRGCHHFYDSELHSDAEERRQLEQDLRDALTNDGLELHYQPVVQAIDQTITGFEALLRWNHPTKGRLSPTKFVPIAEDAGLIGQIGEWALRTACHDLARWPSSVRVAVNVSPLQFSNPALPAIVLNALAQAQVHPSRLELEITESVFLNDDAGTDAMFAALKRVGVRLALDDFGTGYSSLGYLKKAPFDKIKIDQSFVRGATIEGSRNGAIISSIVSLAAALGMDTTAEGVETFDELDMMRTLGCSHIQGYIFSEALDAASACALLNGDLVLPPHGPQSARAQRQTMLRKAFLDARGHVHTVTVRNLSSTGAMVEGGPELAWGEQVDCWLSDDFCISGVVRWHREGRMGIEFFEALAIDGAGAPVLAQRLSAMAPLPDPVQARRVG